VAGQQQSLPVEERGTGRWGYTLLAGFGGRGKESGRRLDHEAAPVRQLLTDRHALGVRGQVKEQIAGGTGHGEQCQMQFHAS